MDTLKGLKNKLPSFNKNMIIVAVVAAIFLALSIYTYKHYIKAGIKPSYVANREYTAGGETGGNNVDLYFFYTNWCPHCKKAMPVWKNFKAEMENKTVKGRQINFLEVDCEKDKQLADEFNVKGYPTIKLVKDNQVIEYDAKPDVDTLREFLNTSI